MNLFFTPTLARELRHLDRPLDLPDQVIPAGPSRTANALEQAMRKWQSHCRSSAEAVSSRLNAIADFAEALADNDASTATALESVR